MACSDREERQRRVAENNAIREREELEKKRLIQERERTLNEFKRIQSPIRGAPPPRSPATGRGPVGGLRPGMIVPSSPLQRPPPLKKPLVVHEARTEKANGPPVTVEEQVRGHFDTSMSSFVRSAGRGAIAEEVASPARRAEIAYDDQGDGG
jgi:hypothetical protein